MGKSLTTHNVREARLFYEIPFINYIYLRPRLPVDSVKVVMAMAMVVAVAVVVVVVVLLSVVNT